LISGGWNGDNEDIFGIKNQTSFFGWRYLKGCKSVGSLVWSPRRCVSAPWPLDNHTTWREFLGGECKEA
jgi:hypothetical protein